jgi:hypothetical protein
LEESDQSDNKYKPNKKMREVRRKTYERYWQMRDDPQRKLEEATWDEADKEYRMYIPDIAEGDWRSHLELPDAFSAIQTSMQETIERKSRPSIIGTDGDGLDPKERFQNAVLGWNMTRTGFDLQYFMAKLAAAIRGTAFLKDYYRVDERTVKDPTGVDADGKLEYKEKKIIDFDDDYTEWVDNQWVYFDPAALTIDDAADCVEREILTMDRFLFLYGNKAEFENTKFVRPGGDLSRTGFFKVPEDLQKDEVEIIHYYNRDTDSYVVLANNVVIRDTPLPTKHKELPFAVVYQYRVPGRFWGVGIPKVVKYLSEERKAIRRLNLDRQKIQIGGFWLVNNAFDLDEEESQARPGGWIGVETGGAPLNNVIQRVDMGDVSASYFRTEEILLEDIRRAHGIDDRIVVSNQGTTATQAAIVKESSLKRVNMISMLAEMDTIIRIGRLKWSNIQFFYKAPQYEKVMKDGEEVDRRVDRKIVVNDMKLSLTKSSDGKSKLKYEEVDGKTTFTLNKSMARYLDGNPEITIDASVYNPMSKAIKQAKTTEMLTTIRANPELAAELDPRKTLKEYLEINEFQPNKWLRDPATKEKMIELADLENHVMKDGQPLVGTEGATIEHTDVHLQYTESVEFSQLPESTQQIIINHILEEHDNNPMTGASADLMQGFGLTDPAQAGPQAMVEGAPAPGLAPQIPGQGQMMDIQPANNNPRPE